jgi:hypothetical protein
MRRIMLSLPEELVREAMHLAQHTGRTLTQLVQDGLRTELRQSAVSSGAYSPLQTFRGEGMRAGIDLSDSDALEDAMGGDGCVITPE